MRLSTKQKAIVALCIVALSYSLLGVAVRLMSTGFGPFTQVYLRIGLSFILTIIFFYKKIDFLKILKITKRDWLILIAMGTLGYGFAVDFVTLGLLHTKLLNAAVIASTTPFFVLLYTLIFFRKSFRLSLLFYLIISFYGVLIIATGSLIPALAGFGDGDLFVLVFAAFSGVYVLGRKLLSSFLNDAEIAVIVMFFAFLSSLTSAIIANEGLQLSGFFNATAMMGFVLGGVFNLTATTFQNFGFSKLNAVLGSQILLLQNVFSAIFGFLLYTELISQIEFIGAILVVAGIWLYIKNTDY
jgi:drug/metabolite transporter (DMT)-like permease